MSGPADARVLPMFPLGSTVFPGQVIPLHIFEERYRHLARDLMAPDGDASFGIVLIDRGHEVGGGDSRVEVATRVEVLQAEEFDDGRWGLVAAGVERIEVLEWLEDAPYPRARVMSRPVTDNGGTSLDELEELLMETLRVAASLSGTELPDDFGFSSDPQQKLDQLSALAPLTEFDRQQILEATTTATQIALLHDALEGKLLVLRAIGE